RCGIVEIAAYHFGAVAHQTARRITVRVASEGTHGDAALPQMPESGATLFSSCAGHQNYTLIAFRHRVSSFAGSSLQMRSGRPRDFFHDFAGRLTVAAARRDVRLGDNAD